MIGHATVLTAIASTFVLLMELSAVGETEVDAVPSKLPDKVLLEATRYVAPGDSTPARQTRGAISGVVQYRTPGYLLDGVMCRTDPDLGQYGCETVEPAEPEPDEPQVTEGDVLRAAREIGMPRLQVQIQPGTRTLVNAETIFYAEPQPFERTVTLLGTPVDLVAEPASYTWFHGDGTTATTSRAGRPYPALDVVHRYRSPADQVQARVDVTYRVRYRIDGGSWEELGQTLTASGPAAALEVREAAPVLVQP